MEASPQLVVLMRRARYDVQNRLGERVCACVSREVQYSTVQYKCSTIQYCTVPGYCTAAGMGDCDEEQQYVRYLKNSENEEQKNAASRVVGLSGCRLRRGNRNWKV